MNAQYRPHARLKMQLYDRLRDALRASGSDLQPVVEVALALPSFSLVSPDLVLTREPEGAGPVPLASVALVVEVADATLENDLGRKARLYADHHVPE